MTTTLCDRCRTPPSHVLTARSLDRRFGHNAGSIRLFVSFRAVALARHPGPALAAFKGVLPREMGMVLADPAQAETIGTVWFHRGSEARGPCSKIAGIPRAIDHGLRNMGRIRKTPGHHSRSGCFPADGQADCEQFPTWRISARSRRSSVNSPLWS